MMPMEDNRRFAAPLSRSGQNLNEQILFASNAYVFIHANNQWKNILENTPSKLLVFNEDGRFILLARLESTDQIVCDILLTPSMVTYTADQNPKWHQFTVRGENPAVNYGLMLMKDDDEGRHFAVLIRNLLKTASGNRYPPGPQRVPSSKQAGYQQNQVNNYTSYQQNQNNSQANYQQNQNSSQANVNYQQNQNGSQTNYQQINLPQEKPNEQGKRMTDEQLQDQIPHEQGNAEPKQRLFPANKQKDKISKLELLCDMLAESIESGNKEKAQEFVSRLTEDKANVTIQLLSVEDNNEKKQEHNITVMVQVEDKETSGPSFRLQVNPVKTTVGMLKNTVLERYDFPREIQRWVIGKRLPKDNESLERCGVKSTGTMIYLYLLSAKDVKQPAPNHHQQQQQQQQSMVIQDSGFTDQYQSGFYDNVPRNMAGPTSNQDNVPFAPISQVPMMSVDGRQQQGPPPVPVRQPTREPIREIMREQRNVTPTPKGWECPSCTYVNIPTRPGCEICGSDRPANYKVPVNLIMDDKEKTRLEQERIAEQMAIEAEQFRKEQEQMEAQRNFAAILQIADRELVPNQAEFECPVCFDAIPPGNGIILRDCLHSFCKECLAETIKNSTDPEIKCPYNDGDVACDANITGQEIRALLTEDNFIKYLARSLSTAEGRAANSFHCKTPNCTSWCEYEDDVNWFRCPICKKLNCLTCKAIHEGQTCKDYQADLKVNAENDEAAKKTQEMLEDMLKKGDAMNCPQCKIILQKKDGCDWMRCSMCRTEICWATKGPRWGEKGNGDTSGGCKCRYNGNRCHPQCKNCH